MKHLHTLYPSIIDYAQSKGSSAKTKNGARKFLLANLGTSVFHFNNTLQQRLERQTIQQKYKQTRSNKTTDGRAMALGYPLTSPQWDMWVEAERENRAYDLFARTQPARTHYGEIVAVCVDTPRYNLEWKQSLDIMRASTLIPTAYDTIAFDRKSRASGSATHRELYDFDGESSVVLVRTTEGTKYGVKTTSKTYYLLTASTATEIKLNVAHLAKGGFPFGYIIAKANGDI